MGTQNFSKLFWDMHIEYIIKQDPEMHILSESPLLSQSIWEGDNRDVLF